VSPLSVFSPRTLPGKLVATSVLLVIGALVLASGVFVALTHGQEKQRALDHTAATAPVIHGEFLQLLLDGGSLSQLQQYVHTAAAELDVRILMFDYSGVVVEDTGGGLSGTQLQIQESQPQGNGAPGPSRNDYYRTWQLEGGSEGSVELVAVFPPLTSRGQRIAIPPPNNAPASNPSQGATEELVAPYRLAIVVPEDTLARAWLHLLPWLALAAAIALPAAIASAIVISRNITRPLSKLTAAADQMAQGAFDIDVPGGRGDEVGQLSRAFSSMARNVGETQVQMRALLANVSHDMRTPLTSILGFAQALRGGVIKGEEQSKHAGDVIYDEVTKLSERLNDLLFLSEIEAGQALLQREDVDLSVLAAKAVERTTAGAAERNVAIGCDVTPGMHAFVDRAKLERVLENLLDNSRKFTPAGGEVRVRTFHDGEQQVCVEVANTATDIDAEELPRLFERFYRCDRARTGPSAGSGLGLPIARDLVELHGGRLEARVADSTITFLMTLPASLPPA
jgi:signal transduction histidine kinase